jgi:hypothetical protein
MKSVLSRVRRFLFWTVLLLVAAYISWGRFEAWRLSRVIADIQARGEPVDYSYWYAKQVTAEQREAASLYARAADYATEAESGQQYRAAQIDVDLPSGPVLTLADIAAVYRPDAPAMQLLDRATPMDFTEFGEDTRGLFDNQIPLQALGAQACLRADLIAARRGDGDAAAAALIPCVRLQRTLLGHYRSQHAARLLGSFRILFRHTVPSDASLAALQRAFADWPDEEVIERGLLQDRAYFLSFLDGRSGSFGEAVMKTLSQPLLTNVTRRRLDSYEEPLALARMPAKERRERIAARRRAPIQTKGHFLDKLTGPVWYSSVSFEAARLDLAARQIMTTVLAVERYRRAHHGTRPPSLATLVPAALTAVPEDPFSEGAGQPITYRSDPDGYVIYTLDSNRRDDGGAFYGHGAAVTKHVGPQSPRDVGIRVPLAPRVH